MDKDICSIQGRVSKLKTRLGNMEKQIKHLQDSVSKFKKKIESVKGQDSPLEVDPQGPCKRTHAHSKRIEEFSKKDEGNIGDDNMQTLVDQAVDLIKST